MRQLTRRAAFRHKGSACTCTSATRGTRGCLPPTGTFLEGVVGAPAPQVTKLRLKAASPEVRSDNLAVKIEN
ncbi:unnamed protein product [Symbiodinium sp. CCMP2592]|nr:unnamed protein product [Symbiodinium sp. CCMP2592]